ncbi:uncharacterized protein B0H64DRAFT_408550 [Chaetomium fimeti]|uniref:C3H1-type domain-containing protein n=1 Tax=Chaetomium fimeti TaxID=1854472 RepID=A0AAE0H8V0_9PEZI|nr:hypothetical protein B0H64DRAFT_408550 [Chaetomium fimeti]
MSGDMETCMIFVDDSNVWIEAQKFAASGNSHMPKLQDSDRDPRLRIDIGKLVGRLLRNRTQGGSFLYGSRPPPNDSVWKAFEKKKFETSIYDRAYNGKEKGVDNAMSVEMTDKATELRVEAKYTAQTAAEKDKTTFVVITGDRDMMPAVERVLKCKIRVELWGWRSGISQAYLDLAATDGLLSVYLLDSIFEDICFTAYRSTRKVQSVVGGKTMVLRNVDESGEEAICDRLLETRQLFWKTRWDGEADLCIEFPYVGQMERLILRARQLLPDVTILSWPEYRARFYNKDPTEDVKTVNMYKLLDPDFVAEDEQGGAKIEERLQNPTFKNATENASGNISGNASGNTNSTGSGYNSGNASADASGNINSANDRDTGDDSDGGGWETVVNNTDAGKRHRRVVDQQQDCPYGLRCKKQDDCGYRHSARERHLFQQNPNRNLGMRNTQMCRYAANCWRGRDCLYAHSEAEARCLDCKQTGHFRGDAAKCLLQT